MASRKPLTVPDLLDEGGDLGATQESIEAELAVLEKQLERLNTQLAERRALLVASLAKRKPKVKGPVKPRTVTKGTRKP